MFSRLSRTLAFATAALLGAGAMPAVMAQPAMTSAAPRPVQAGKRAVSGVRRSLGLYGRKSAGITAAQQKRASAKRRNVARNRSNHR
jgi:hypothetical protein